MPRFAPDSWNPAVNITAWFLMSSNIVCVICRLTTKWLIFRTLTADDYLIVLSLVSSCKPEDPNASPWLFTFLVYQSFCIGNTISLSMATANGYGDHTSSASRAKQFVVMKVCSCYPMKHCLGNVAILQSADIMRKSQFAATLLFVLSILFSKLSMAKFVHSLSPTIRDRRVAHGVQALVVVTGVVGLFGSAFQCRLPRTWDYIRGNCIDEVGTHSNT